MYASCEIVMLSMVAFRGVRSRGRTPRANRETPFRHKNGMDSHRGAKAHGASLRRVGCAIVMDRSGAGRARAAILNVKR